MRRRRIMFQRLRWVQTFPALDIARPQSRVISSEAGVPGSGAASTLPVIDTHGNRNTNAQR